MGTVARRDRKRQVKSGSRAGLRRRRAPSLPTVGAEVLEDRVLLTAGDIDWSGVHDFRPSDNDGFYDTAVQADGKIVAVGVSNDGFHNNFLVARFNPNGTLDTTFSGDGVTAIGFPVRNSTAASVAIRADGKIVVGGTTREVSAGSVEDFGIVRLNADGSLDATFGTLGRVIWNSPASSYATLFEQIALTPDGRIVGVGYYYTDVAEVGFVLRYTADGSPDATFDGDGIKEVIGAAISDVVIDPAGRTVMSTTDGVYRLTESGAFDATFGGGDGFADVTFEAGAYSLLTAVGLTPDGRIVVAGNSEVGDDEQPGVARLLSNGLYDPSFHYNGRVSFDITPGESDYIGDLAVLPDGSVVVAGRNTAAARDWVMALVTPAGLLDTAFSADGKRTVNAGGTDGFGGVAALPNGDLVLVGRITGAGIDAYSAIARVEGIRRAEDLVGYHAGNWQVGRSTGFSFQSSVWAAWSDIAWDALRHGDFNGDGRTDVLGLTGGNWWIGLATDSGFQTSLFGTWANAAWQNVTVADLNNDGRDDILTRENGNWWAADSLGNSFAPPTLRATWANVAWTDVTATDLNGDGTADLLGRAGGNWWAATSNGVAFVGTSLWAGWVDGDWTTRTVTDANGDGLTDLVGLTGGNWWVGLSNGSAFVTSLWASWAPVAWQDARVGDFDGDGRDDVLARAGGNWWVGRSQNGSFVTSLFGTWSDLAWQDVRTGDFDGDGRDDLVGRAGGNWWVGTSNGASLTTNFWGTWADVAWQAVAAAEVSRNSSAPPAVAFAVPVALPVLAPVGDTDDDLGWSLWSEDEEFGAILLAG